MTQAQLPPRHAISRAKFFVTLADQCPVSERDAHEAFMEAAVVFCRTAIHRLQTRYEKCTDWKIWFNSLKDNPSIRFIRKERDWILKEAPPKVGQRICIGHQIEKAKCLYYFVGETDSSAIDTVVRHVDEIERVIREGDQKFGSTEYIRA